MSEFNCERTVFTTSITRVYGYSQARALNSLSSPLLFVMWILFQLSYYKNKQQNKETENLCQSKATDSEGKRKQKHRQTSLGGSGHWSSPPVGLHSPWCT